MNIAVITTFPSNMYSVYAEKMLSSFAQFWPAEIPLLVQLDDDRLVNEVKSKIRPQDAISWGWSPEHAAFVERNKDKDDPQDYRKQATRFCHKVFAIYRAYQAAKQARDNNEPGAPRYLIWLDADVITTRQVTMDDIQKCLPKEGDAVSYLGRKDWPHSECGWLVFDLENGGADIIEAMHKEYLSDNVFNLTEWHDSWIFDRIMDYNKTVLHKRKPEYSYNATNLTQDKPGMDIWQHSPMAEWSVHYKGPVAKSALVAENIPRQSPQMMPQIRNPHSNIQIQTKNAIPDEQIQSHIRENQELISNWIEQCTPNDEELVIVSAGPQMYPEDVLEDYRKGKKIVAVKHALGPLKQAGITPWATILLDPRPHVANFVEDADPDVLWIVASQVNPAVTKKLLERGCTVWGYHASVGAGEHELTNKQPGAVISGGSATATRGLFVLKQLGFRKFKLFGYDLCYPDKPDLNARDQYGQPKYLEMSVGWNNPLCSMKKCFWSEPQLIAQFEEINQLIQSGTFELKAVGDGLVPFVLKQKEIGDLRQAKLKGKIKPKSYKRLLKWTQPKKTRFSIRLPKL